MSTDYYDQSYPPSLWQGTAPTVGGINPTTAVISTPITLTVNGTGFVSGDTVLTGGTVRPTTFVSATQLTATWTTPATAQTVQVSVRSTAGDSNARPFTVTAAQVQSEPMEGNQPERPG